MERVFDLFDLSGKIAIITGGGRGIGFAIAEGLASAGAISVIGDIQADLGEAAAGRIRSKGFPAKFIRVDVTQRTSVQDLVTKVNEEFHQIDILVNNAGVILRKPIV